jgi:hypothetical protein
MRLASMTNFGPAAANTRKLIAERKDFEILNLSGSFGGWQDSHSRMPTPWWNEFEHDRKEGRIVYTVRSWVTPIAWFIELPFQEGGPYAEWVMPSIGYTAYTSRHQGLVRRALRDADIVPRDIVRREFMHITIDWEWEVSA